MILDTYNTQCNPSGSLRMVDLFSGIGGFSLAASWVWGYKLEIVAFCEIDKFCQKVLKKHWPTVPIINDIGEVTGERITTYARQFTTRNESNRFSGEWFNSTQKKLRTETRNGLTDGCGIDLLTGGFPCQPFSCAGKRKGRADDRFLWPEMLRVIREVHPTWVIAENVGGLFTQEQGMVFGQVLSDLENEGYEVQPFLIPACAKNAPHRRDRWWIVAHTERTRTGDKCGEACDEGRRTSKDRREGIRQKNREISTSGFTSTDSHVADTDPRGFRRYQREGIKEGATPCGGDQWNENWYSVALRTCIRSMDDGLPRGLARHRTDKLKALGNSVLPQIPYEIMRAIKEKR